MIEQFFAENWFNLVSFATSSVAAVVAWWQSRKVRKVEEEKAAYDLHKEMYSNMADDLQKLQDKVLELFDERAKDAEEKAEMRAEMARMKRDKQAILESIEANRFCPHRVNCPVQRTMLQLAPDILQSLKGQHRPRDGDMDKPLEEVNIESDHPP